MLVNVIGAAQVYGRLSINGMGLDALSATMCHQKYINGFKTLHINQCERHGRGRTKVLTSMPGKNLINSTEVKCC